MRNIKVISLVDFAILIVFLNCVAFAVEKPSQKKATVRKTSASRTVKKRVHRPAARKTSRRPAIRKAKYTRPRKVYSPWTEPTYADSTLGDNVDGEVLEVRRAAVEALGQYNGSVVVVDPNTGRILTMVNQKLALGSGFQPCSTIKVPVALAALAEGLIAKDKIMPAAGARMNLTTALAKSNNSYFANLGIKLGYDRVSFYARMFGLGEKAGLNIPGESPGYFPKAPPKNGGMGMLTSFGEEISLTPLQLAAMMSAVANDGTLYYLQYPRSEAEAENLVPRIKRRLDMEQWIPEVKPGLAGTVQFGTARRAFEPDDPVLGKTGTCTEARTHLGWFGSFNDIGPNKLVVVVLLTGGRPSVGSTAAGVASDVYSRLSETNYFTRSRPITPVALISIGQ